MVGQEKDTVAHPHGRGQVAADGFGPQQELEVPVALPVYPNGPGGAAPIALPHGRVTRVAPYDHASSAPVRDPVRNVAHRAVVEAHRGLLASF